MNNFFAYIKTFGGGVIFFIVVIGLIAVYIGMLLNANSADERSITDIQERCMNSGGILVEGLSAGEDNSTGRFYICIPSELYTCVDVE